METCPQNFGQFKERIRFAAEVGRWRGALVVVFGASYGHEPTFLWKKQK